MFGQNSAVWRFLRRGGHLEGVGVGNLKLNFKDYQTGSPPKRDFGTWPGGVGMRTRPILEWPYQGEMIVKSRVSK